MSVSHNAPLHLLLGLKLFLNAQYCFMLFTETWAHFFLSKISAIIVYGLQFEYILKYTTESIAIIDQGVWRTTYFRSELQ